MANKSELTPEQEIEQLKKQLADKEAKEAELTQALAEKDGIIDEQLQALEDAEASRGKALPAVTVDGTQYQVASAKFQHPFKDEVVTAEQLVADKELLAKLISLGSGILVPIVK